MQAHEDARRLAFLRGLSGAASRGASAPLCCVREPMWHPDQALKLSNALTALPPASRHTVCGGGSARPRPASLS